MTGARHGRRGSRRRRGLRPRRHWAVASVGMERHQGLSLQAVDAAAPLHPAAFKLSSECFNVEGVQCALAVVHVAAVGHHRGYVRISTPRGAPQGWYSYDDMRVGGSMVRMDQLTLPLAERRQIGTLLFIRKDCE